jgi:hypothetical protein
MFFAPFLSSLYMGAGAVPAMEQCQLCLNHVAKLEDSHFLSKGIYKRLRDDKEKNPNPWQITPKTAVQTSDQMKARLLCRDCEQRFCKLGENWVLSNCLQKDCGFPLASILSLIPPDVSPAQNHTKLYYASKIPEINVSALAYFAVSIFWRGSIHPWNHDGTIPVKLGPYQEQFRQYLLGMQAFPKDCSLCVVLREGKEIDRLTYPPVGQRKGTFHLYRFPMPGLAFTLAVSRNIPPSHREMCFVHGRGNPLFVTSCLEPLLLDEARKFVQRHVKPHVNPFML